MQIPETCSDSGTARGLMPVDSTAAALPDDRDNELHDRGANRFFCGRDGARMMQNPTQHSLFAEIHPRAGYDFLPRQHDDRNGTGTCERENHRKLRPRTPCKGEYDYGDDYGPRSEPGSTQIESAAREPNRDQRSSTSTRPRVGLRCGMRVRVRVRQSESPVCSQARKGCSDYQHGGHCRAPDPMITSAHGTWHR